MKHFYKKPTLPNIQLEDRLRLIQTKHEKESAYEWNINGMIEHNIFNHFQEIAMAPTTYKTKHNMDKAVAQTLIASFT